jgi:hypothetical protein
MSRRAILPAHDNANMTDFQIISAFMVPLAAWRLYSRYRKLIGKQFYAPRKLWGSLFTFTTLVILIGLHNLDRNDALAALLAGATAGVCLAFVGIGLTRFECENDVVVYTPNVGLGIALMSLLCGRIGYRFFRLADAPSLSMQAMLAAMVENPVTVFVIGVLACYYAVYSFGVLYRCTRSGSPIRP